MNDLIHKKLLLIGTFFLLTSLHLNAQNIKEFAFKIEGEKIRVTYNLLGEPSERYTITLFSSASNFSSPLRFVEGDVGEGVSPGDGKTILWDARREFSEFKGSINLKIKYKIQVAQYFTTITENARFKKGKRHNIAWPDGPEGLNATIKLFNGNDYIMDVPLYKSGIEWALELPKKMKTGKGYRFQTDNNGKPIYSHEFRITNTVPRALIIVPIIMGGIVTAVLITSKNKDESIGFPIRPN